jgi:hypothetical protein
MDSHRLLALGLSLGGVLAAVYATTELAGLFFGVDWMPDSLQRIGQLDRAGPESNRLGRTVPLLVLLAAVELAVVLALTSDHQEFDVVDLFLFAGQPIATIIWVAWLLRLRVIAPNR